MLAIYVFSMTKYWISKQSTKNTCFIWFVNDLFKYKGCLWIKYNKKLRLKKLKKNLSLDRFVPACYISFVLHLNVWLTIPLSSLSPTTIFWVSTETLCNHHLKNFGFISKFMSLANVPLKYWAIMKKEIGFLATMLLSF